MSDTLIIVLSSTVVATILSSLVSYFISKKNGSLQYITSERKEWRNEMRLLAEEIYDSDLISIGKTLVKLKVRINCYGKYIKDFNKDYHIWELIDNIESCNLEDEFNHYKAILINYISLLLKADWERSKDEVIGNILSILTIFLYLVNNAFILYYLYPLVSEGIIIMTMASLTISLFVYPKIIYKMLSKENKYNDIFFIIYFMIVFIFYSIIIITLLDKEIDNVIFVTLIILFISVLTVTFINTDLKLRKNNNYRRAIKSEKKLSKQPIDRVASKIN